MRQLEVKGDRYERKARLGEKERVRMRETACEKGRQERQEGKGEVYIRGCRKEREEGKKNKSLLVIL